MPNWSKPDLSSTKTNFLTEAKELIYQSAALSYPSATNLPNATIQYDRVSKKFQEWNSTTSLWEDREISGNAATSITKAMLVAVVQEALFDSGDIIATGRSTARTGWLICDGSAISRTTYASLFSAIGTAYGSGDGSTTFNLPDLRQRFPIGKAASGTASTLGSVGGAIDHNHSIPAHYHGKGTLSINSSGTHTTAIDHDHGSFNSGATGTKILNNGVVAAGTSGSFTGTLYGGGFADFFSGNIVDDHTHSVDVPNFTGNSASNGAHTHSNSDFAGSVGNTGGSNGDASFLSGTNNPPYQVVNYMIKT